MNFQRWGSISLFLIVMAWLFMGIWSVTTMAQSTKWFKLAKEHLQSNNLPGANEAIVSWSKSKNWIPDARYFTVVAEIAERSGQQATAGVCDKQSRQLMLEAAK